MKKCLIIMMGAMIAMLVNPLVADDAKTTKAPAIPKKKATSSSEGPVDRKIEIRAGPRATFLTGDFRVGRTGTSANIWDDINLQEVNPGAQFDIDWQPFNRWHFDVGVTYDAYEQKGSLKKALLTDRGDLIQPGALTKASFDFYSYEGKIGFDVIKNRTYRLQPYVGGKGLSIDGKISIAGDAVTAAPNSKTVTGSRESTYKQDYGLFFGGIDQRLYVSRDWYLGGDFGASGLDNWYYFTGDAYTGYDFNKTWGVRVGYAYDYLSMENTNKSVKVEPLLGAVYVQVVYGF